MEFMDRQYNFDLAEAATARAANLTVSPASLSDSSASMTDVNRHARFRFKESIRQLNQVCQHRML
eukprot:3966950-Pleurochrysis_carterae.AAC.1